MPFGNVTLNFTIVRFAKILLPVDFASATLLEVGSYMELLYKVPNKSVYPTLDRVLEIISMLNRSNLNVSAGHGSRRRVKTQIHSSRRTIVLIMT